MRSWQIVSALREYKASEHHTTIVTDVLTDYLADYIERLDIPSEREYDFYETSSYLPTILLRALTALATSDEEWIVDYRERFKKDHGDLGGFVDASFIQHDNAGAFLTMYECESILKNALGEDGRWLDFSMLHGESLVLNLHFNRFLDEIYIRGGMRGIIDNAKMKGVGGMFGETKLLTWDGIGRLLFTFKRGKYGTESYESITFIMESGKNGVAFGAGIHSCCADVIAALTMIKDVQDHWDIDKFVEDQEISIG